MQFPPVPPEVKSIAHFLKVAEEHEERNVVVAYWARMFACQRAMQLVPGKKPDSVSKLLIALMDWMEMTKKANLNNDGITNDTTAHALIEEYALQLFSYGDTQDRASNFNKNTIKAFYTAGILMDILEQFGPLSEDIQGKRKYAKWKAAYIHNCLKVGDIPIPGGPDENLDNVVHRADLDKDDDINTAPSDPFAVNPPPRNDENPFFPTEPSSLTPQPSVAPPTPSPYIPVVNPTTPQLPMPASSDHAALSPEKIKKAQKFCKFAESALDYEDYKAAIENLNKALHLIKTGEEL
ncbi:vacuolar protein sorting-associated protein VTA1 homolog [Coccinella septempunctata]|uniref:vacuolar protein sorting-associated protein VTA1 homolog n=1 Tax=Coccinella septempunctata TaxID=41139 RepID=UPI001D085D5A|nr:vacuolar protein sorting-associated protein VTA1 homolog [Coccinella septempunctata]